MVSQLLMVFLQKHGIIGKYANQIVLSLLCACISIAITCKCKLTEAKRKAKCNGAFLAHTLIF